MHALCIHSSSNENHDFDLLPSPSPSLSLSLRGMLRFCSLWQAQMLIIQSGLKTRVSSNLASWWKGPLLSLSLSLFLLSMRERAFVWEGRVRANVCVCLPFLYGDRLIYLYRGDLIKSWKRRLFILRENMQLIYYAVNERPEPRGTSLNNSTRMHSQWSCQSNNSNNNNISMTKAYWILELWLLCGSPRLSQLLWRSSPLLDNGWSYAILKMKQSTGWKN